MSRGGRIPVSAHARWMRWISIGRSCEPSRTARPQACRACSGVRSAAPNHGVLFGRTVNPPRWANSRSSSRIRSAAGRLICSAMPSRTGVRASSGTPSSQDWTSNGVTPMARVPGAARSRADGAAAAGLAAALVPPSGIGLGRSGDSKDACQPGDPVISVGLAGRPAGVRRRWREPRRRVEYHHGRRPGMPVPLAAGTR